jgi:nitroimidazol reductase NimA-like FMN-containing flavoprotein (pyridoxamine 5'-phosphate oxidase superfamily)
MTKLKPNEASFLEANEVCRLATASKAAKPHVTPVIYALDDASFIIVVDYGTKKLKNVKENPLVSLVVDRLRPNKAVMIEGKCKVYERGPEYRRLLKLLFDKFEFYRNDPWGEGESPILRITPTKVVSWGLK